jgi:hypothetical protein
MPVDIVNLRRARKAKARSEREKTAADNRAAFGRSKAEKQLTKAEHERAARTIDAHRRELDKT